MSDFLSQQWQTFCSITGLKTFAFIFNSDSKVERIFWCLSLLIAIALTVNDVSKSVILFQSGPTHSKITMLSNRTFNLSNVVICAGVNYEDLNVQNLDVSNFSEVKQFLDKFANVKNIHNFFDKELQKLQEAATNTYWDLKLTQRRRRGSSNLIRPNYTSTMEKADERFVTLTYLTALMMSKILRAELLENDYLNTTDINWGYSRNGETDQSVIRSLQAVYNFYYTKEPRMRQILERVGATVWCNWQFLVFRSNGFSHEWPIPHCQPELITWFGQAPNVPKPHDLTCIRLVPDVISFKDTREAVIVEFSSPSIDFVRLFMASDPVRTEESQNVLYLAHGYAYMVDIHMTGHYRFISSPDSLCADHSHVDCMLACRSAYITEHCGCEPIFSTFLTRTMTDRTNCRPKIIAGVDTIPGYTTTAKCQNITKTQLRATCDQLCLEPCERKIWQLSAKQYQSDQQMYNHTSIEIYIDSFIYPLFEEKYLTEAKQFLSQLGGNLSLWLGASFLVLLHIGVFVAKLPSLYWTYKKTSELSIVDQINPMKFDSGMIQSNKVILLDVHKVL